MKIKRFFFLRVAEIFRVYFAFKKRKEYTEYFNNKITFAKAEWFDFTASLESQYHFRQNEFPPNIMVFSPSRGQDILLEINTPPSAYHLLNFDTGMKFKMGDESFLNLGFTINNLANTTYRNYLNRQRYFADDLGRNILINLNVKADAPA